MWWGLLLLPFGLLCWWKRAFLPTLLFIFGAFWVTFQSGLLLQDNLPKALEGKDLRVEGFIANLPEITERSVRFDFEVVQASFDGESVKIPQKVRLNRYDLDWLPEVGDRWAFVVRLKRPNGFQNPGGFDYEGYLFRERIRAIGYVRDDEPPRLIASNPFSYPIGHFRQYLSAGINNALPQNPYAGIITAFANGDETGVTDSQWEILRRTGTTHLIAISGMNIGLIAGIAFFLMRWAWALPGHTVLRAPAPKVAAITAMGAAIFYSALAGFAIPTQRAMIMLAVVMGAILLNRSSHASHLLAMALFLVLFYDPLAVMSAGFWLSFAAVAIIVLAIHGRLGETKRWQLGRLQWVIAIGLLPLLLGMFQQTSLSGPFANMLAIPVIELWVIPATLLGIVMLTILPEPVSAFVLQAAALPMGVLWLALEYLAGPGQTQWVQHTPLPWTLAVAVPGTLLLLAPRGWPARWVGAIWLLPMLLIRPAAPAPGEVWFTLLDVGQGLAAVARTERHVLVFDTGPRFSARFDTGSAVVAPYLRHSGVEVIDTLIVSHGDNDHIGGAESLLASFPARRVLSSVPERLPDAEHCQAGETWQWDGVEFTILNPDNVSKPGNNASCVLKVVSRHGSILLTGDIESEAEGFLVRHRRETLSSKVLVVPHHGSKTSSTQAFIGAIAPELALLPVGYRSRFGHPHPEVVERYGEHGIRLLDSVKQGAITLRLRAEGMEISGYRQEHKRYWFNE